MIPATVISRTELDGLVKRRLGFAFPIEWDQRIEGREYQVVERPTSNQKLAGHVLGGIQDVGIVLNAICADGAIEPRLFIVR